MPEARSARQLVDEITFPVEVPSLLTTRGTEPVNVGGVEVAFREVLKRLPCERYASKAELMGDVRLVLPAVVGDRSPGPGQVE